MYDIYGIGDGEFDLNARYKVATTLFIAKGGDGFDMFTDEDVKYIVDEENGKWIIDIVKQALKRMHTDYKIDTRRELDRQIRARLWGVDT